MKGGVMDSQRLQAASSKWVPLTNGNVYAAVFTGDIYMQTGGTGALMDFETWWYETGSGILPLPGADMEEHGKRVAGEAWDAAIKGFLEAWEHGKVAED